VEVKEIKEKYHVSQDVAEYLFRVSDRISRIRDLDPEEFVEIQKSTLGIKCRGEEYLRGIRCLQDMLNYNKHQGAI
jgi:hypothetical protein